MNCLPICSDLTMARAEAGYPPNLPNCMYPIDLRDNSGVSQLVASKGIDVETEIEAP